MKKLRFIARVFLVLLLAFATEASPSFAQVKSSAITGTVSDKNGAVLPNATVTVTQQETNTVTTAQSDSKGEYTVPYLGIGHYTLTVSAPGFETYRKTDITLAGNTSVRADVPMAVGNTTTSIDVKADALAVQTENAQVSDAVGSDTITNQANINGNSLYFATLESGVVGDPQQLGSQALGVGYSDRRNMSGMRINGGEIGSNDVLLDGISIQGAAWHETAVLPNSDALSEVRVTTNNFTADTGMAQGVVSQTTKAGTNAFHGDLNFMLRNEDLNANSYSNKHQYLECITGTPAQIQACKNQYVRPTYRLLQGGGAIGGPIIIPHLYNGKDKLFFFGSFLRLTHSSTTAYTATVPTALERTGNFCQTLLKNSSGAPEYQNVYNPFSASSSGGSTTLFVRNPYPGDGTMRYAPGATSGAQALSSACLVTNPNAYGLKILQGYPLPNAAPSDVYNTNNFANTVVSPEYRNSFNGRIDFKPVASQSIFFSAGISNGGITNPNEWGTFANGPWTAQPGMGNVIDKNPYGAIGDTIVLNPTTVLDIRYGVTHINTAAQRLSSLGDPSAYGQPGFVAAAAPFGPGNLPGIPAIGSYSALNSNSYGNKSEHQLNHFVNGSISKIAGKLTMKFGGEYRVYLQNYHDIQWQSPPLTTTVYTGQFAAVDGTNVTASEADLANRGSAASSVVAGVEGWQMTAGTAPVLALASKYTGAYAQGTWRPTDKWLLSFGIRYEVQPGPTERTNRMASYVLERTSPFATSGAIHPAGNLGYMSFPGVGGYSRNLYETNWDNVAPRLGATYQLNDKTVLRGGYGRNYLPSNTGYNANTTIYNPLAFDTAVNAIPYGLGPTNATPAGTFDQATNTYVIPGAGPVQVGANYGGNGGVTVFNRTQYKTGHTDQWNLFIERQLGSTWTANMGYVGSKGGTLPWRGYLMNGPFSVNPATLAAWRASWINSNGTSNPAAQTVPNPMTSLIGQASGDSGGANITQMEANEPYLDLLNDTDYISVGKDQYHSFVVKIQHSTSHGLQFGANYTWAKATGLVGNSGTQTFAESQQGNSSGPTGGVDYYNHNNNHALLDYDIANRFVANGSYALPIGKGRAFNPGNTFVRDIIGDWSVTTAVTLQGGNPFGPSCAAASNTTTAGTLNGRCNPAPGQPLLLPASQQRYYNGTETLTLPDGRIVTPAINTFMKWNPDAWVSPTITFANGKSAQDQYQLGSTPLAMGNMRTFGVQNVNLSVVKKIPITEHVSFDLHVNATNALNHTNHEVLNNTVTPVTAAAAGNTVVGQNSNVSYGSYGLTNLEARQLTIQANLTF